MMEENLLILYRISDGKISHLICNHNMYILKNPIKDTISFSVFNIYRSKQPVDMVNDSRVKINTTIYDFYVVLQV